MADYYSTQETLRAAGDMVSSRDSNRVRRFYFDYTVPVGNIAAAKTIALRTVDYPGRLLGGAFCCEAMTTAGGDSSIQLGDGTTAAKYLGTTSVDGATALTAFANTCALYFGEEISAGWTLWATTATESWAAGQDLRGYVDIMIA